MDRLLVIDGDEITSHNRDFSISETQTSVDQVLLTGSKRRFVKDSKKTFSLNFKYLPDKDSITVDSRSGRNTLLALADKRSSSTLEVETEPGAGLVSYEVYLENYSEKAVRRDFNSQCIYYDIQMSFVEA